MKRVAWFASLFAWLLCTVPAAKAQGRPGLPVEPPASPKQIAPIDLTGYWVSLVTEDWMQRMVVPRKGDLSSVPLNAAARASAASWDPAKDEAAGEQCKGYGAAAIMRIPGRIHIAWQDDNALKIDYSAGKQSRMLHFNGVPSSPGEMGYQGYSVASWEGLMRGRGRGPAPRPAPGQDGAVPETAGAPLTAARAGGVEAQVRPGFLKIVTTHLVPGYLRRNGIPYSAKATVTEYIDKVTEPNGQALLIVKTIVEDPEFLNQPFITSTHFKKEPDGSKFSPTACAVK